MFKKVSDLLNVSGHNYKKNYGRSKSTSSSELFDFLSLIEKWEDIVGAKLAKVTVPLKNQRKTLTILTNHSAYSQSLSFMEDTLKKKILKIFPELRGRITKFNFIVSTEHFDKQRHDLLRRTQVHKTEKKQDKKNNEYHPQSPQFKKLRVQAENEFKDIEDKEIKEKLISIFIQSNFSKQS